MDKVLAKYEIPISKIEVYRDRVEFTHKSIGPLYSNTSGTKVVYIKDITSVELKEPTFFSLGYLQVNFAGKNFSGNPVGGFKVDEYAIQIGKNYLSPAKVVWSCIRKLISEHKNNESNNQNSFNNTTSSGASEILKYKNLLDMGAITQEEFDAKKKQLLGL